MKSLFALLLCLSSLMLLSACDPLSAAVAGIGKSAQLHNQERGTGDAVDDLIIETTINHRYFRTDVNDLFQNVDADVHEGRVFLTGNVKQHDTMMKAVNLAWEVKGVKEVINELQVDNTSGIVDNARDVWIEMQIESRLLVEKNVHNSNYNVESVNGIVTLMGVAQNQQELDKVTDITARTRGVRQVISHVIMKDDPRRITPKADKPQSGTKAPAPAPVEDNADWSQGGWEEIPPSAADDDAWQEVPPEGFTEDPTPVYPQDPYAQQPVEYDAAPQQGEPYYEDDSIYQNEWNQNEWDQP